jgi:hypothetical protein
LLEQLTCREQNLIGSLSAAAFAPHAIGQHRQHATGGVWVGHDLDLILLVGSIAAVNAGCGGKTMG